MGRTASRRLRVGVAGGLLVSGLMLGSASGVEGLSCKAQSSSRHIAVTCKGTGVWRVNVECVPVESWSSGWIDQRTEERTVEYQCPAGTEYMRERVEMGGGGDGGPSADPWFSQPS